MSIIQFLRIVWAYRLLIVVSTVACTLMAVVVVQVVKPRYEAQSRVMLDVIKPDPVTGEAMSTAFLRTYTKTQIELVKDLQVADRVVKNLGLSKDPYFIREYRDRSSAQRALDFDRWAAEEVAEGANARAIDASNILEISYVSSAPARARVLADGIRQAYIDISLESRREAARRNAEWHEIQAEKSKLMLMQAEQTKSEYERTNGILLQDDKVDIDSVRLSALASQSGAPLIASVAASPPSAPMLAAVESELGEASKVLGPNHPTLQALRARKAALVSQVENERAAANNSAGAAMSAAQANGGMLEAQKIKVLGQREKVERLRLMQDEIDLRREQYSKGVARAAELRKEAEVAEAGLIPLAAAVEPQEPEFPKRGIIIPAATIGGAGLGLVIGLMLEMIGRLVRSADDLAGVIKAPVLAVVRGAPQPMKVSFRMPSLRRAPRPAAAGAGPR